MDFSATECPQAAKKIFALLLIVGLTACSSGADTESTVSPIQQPPTAPSNPPTNNAPDITGNPATSVQAGMNYTFQPMATDAETSPSQLVYAISVCPTWATCVNGMGTNAGRISGTPQASHVGTTSNIVITVTDQQGNTDSLPAFSITVTAVNQAPTITGTPPASVQVNSMYSFTPTINDPDGPSRTVTFVNFPTWLNNRNASTGAVSGTPLAGDERTYSNLQIRVFDGANTTTLGPFSITVTPLVTTNRPPAITGTPTTSIVAGQSYSFTPNASDPDGDTPNGGGLTFSINTVPTWATFNTLTGQLSGPATAGTTANIIISVRDRQGAVAALSPFSLTVQASPPTGTARVSWTAPTTNTDTTPLIDLSGFRVLYGSSPTNLSQSSPRIASGTTEYTVNGLASGTWYFAVVAYNLLLIESDHSAIASKVIP